MSDPILPSQRGQMTDKDGLATVPWYNWARLVQSKLTALVATTASTTSTVAALPAPTVQTVINPSADIIPFGSPNDGYLLLLSAAAKASASGSSQAVGMHLLIDTDYPDLPMMSAGSGSGNASTSGQAAIQFKSEGTNLGASGTVETLDVTGAGVTAVRAANKVTINVPGAVGGGGTASDIGLVLQLPFAPIFL